MKMDALSCTGTMESRALAKQMSSFDDTEITQAVVVYQQTGILADVLRCCFNISTKIYPWCHLFYKVLQFLLQQSSPHHDAATPELHSWEGLLRLASLNLFPPNTTIVNMVKPVKKKNESDHWTFLQKVRYLSPCTVSNCKLAFLE